MHFAPIAVAALVGAVQAAEVHVVSVGMDPATKKTGQKFWPEKIEAKVGDSIQWQFWAEGSNHTVTQSSFDNPCTPLGREGIHSDFQPFREGSVAVFTAEVKDTKPMWFYCAQGKHCQNGMGMVVNENTSANSTRSLENFKELAAREEGPAREPGGASGGKATTTDSASLPKTTASAGNSDKRVAVPVALLLALASAFMLL